MNFKPEDDLQRRFQKIGNEIKSTFVHNESSPPKSHLAKMRRWFNSLPILGKVTITLGILLAGLAIVQLLMKMVQIAVGVAVLAVLVYLGYKKLVSGKFLKKQ